MGAPYALSSDLVSAWPAKSLEVAQYIDGQLPLIAMTQNAQTGVTYTLAATDFTKLVTLSNASPVTVTVPLESSVPWVAGTQLRLMNLGAGVVTVVGAGGVTINGSPLTLAQYKEGTLTKTGTNTWTFTGSASAPGMELVTPTSVVNGTASGGAVSFSAVSSVSLNGVFSATYENYVIRINITNSSTSGAFINARMRTGGSDESGASYRSQRLYQLGTSVVGAENPSANTVMSLGYMASTVPTSPVVDCRVFSPFSAARTSIVSDGVYIGSDSSFVQNRIAAQIFNTTSYDSISFLAESGTMTGTIRIYGLRNS
jgi:hypothetical protein